MAEKLYDIFISYSSKDQKLVEAMCHYLEERNLRCFVAYRDVPKGKDWAPYIEKGIEDSKVLVYVHTESSNMSEETTREINLAFEEGCVVIPFRVNSIKYGEGKRYRLNNLNWLDAFPGNPENYFGDLFDILKVNFPERIQQKEEEQERLEEEKAEQERLERLKRNAEKTSPGKEFDIFICYRRSDGSDKARILNSYFKEKGFRTFLDYVSLTGERFDERIEQAIKDSSVFIMVLTPDFFARCNQEGDWVRKEVDVALRSNKIIIPIDFNGNFNGFPDYLDEHFKMLIGAHCFERVYTDSTFEPCMEHLLDRRIRPYILREEKTLSSTEQARLEAEKNKVKNKETTNKNSENKESWLEKHSFWITITLSIFSCFFLYYFYALPTWLVIVLGIPIAVCIWWILIIISAFFD
ncbi:MAG: toll/interleukin-1 receptor domain-containing protein [Bacteroidales bacterium]|nr:toll/interleukin-1 receptor domain-containing protein [Bacteroidales bacterium]